MKTIDAVWERIKAAAQTIASSGNSIRHDEARALVLRFVAEERAETPPHEALDFLARQLCTLSTVFENTGSEIRTKVHC